MLLLAVLGVIALYPWETTVVPEWRVRIVDQGGAPLRNTGVREIWQHYSIESRSHEEDLLTDQEGYVTFPRRMIRAGLAVRTIRPMINALNPHHTSGPGASVIVLAPDYDTWSNNATLPGRPLPREVVLAIQDSLDTLPRSYARPIYAQKCELIYQHVYDSYFGSGQSVYSATA